MSDFNIENELKKLPTSPGVYLMHKFDGEVIYVGKAKNLKNRVKQYFSDSYQKTSKIEQMVANIDYFEYVVVDNELESLILESNFIKEYRPRYNTLLKDDKNYPYRYGCGSRIRTDVVQLMRLPLVTTPVDPAISQISTRT